MDLVGRGTLSQSMSEERRRLADRLYRHVGVLAERLASDAPRQPRDERLIEDLAIAIGLLAEAAQEVRAAGG